MAPIKLTKSHKKKLLKMCIWMFPEMHNKAVEIGSKYYDSKEIALANCCGFYITGDGNIQCSYPIYERDDSFHNHLIKPIHWFEFCMTYLCDKLKINPIFPISRAQAIQGLSQNKYNGQHPVDYLYSKFKLAKP